MVCVYRRDSRPALPPPEAGPVAALRCGLGELVTLLLADGYEAEGIDISPGQVAFAGVAGAKRVKLGDYRAIPAGLAGYYAAVTATTHESAFTPRSVIQMAAAGFGSVTVWPSPSVAHGLISGARAAVWKPVSLFYRIVLAAEMGVLRGHVVTQNLTLIARKVA